VGAFTVGQEGGRDSKNDDHIGVSEGVGGVGTGSRGGERLI